MKKTLLLADDSPTIQKVINLTFADEGIEVVSVSDGNAALQYLSGARPDLVMADVHMPGLDGYQICEKVRQNPELRGVPVILLVGSFEPFDEDEAKRVGADDFLMKPFQSIRQLVGRVTALLEPSPESLSEPETSFHEDAAPADVPVAETPAVEHSEPEFVPDAPSLTAVDVYQAPWVANSVSYESEPAQVPAPSPIDLYATPAAEAPAQNDEDDDLIEQVSQAEPISFKRNEDLADFDSEFNHKFPDAAALSSPNSDLYDDSFDVRHTAPAVASPAVEAHDEGDALPAVHYQDNVRSFSEAPDDRSFGEDGPVAPAETPAGHYPYGEPANISIEPEPEITPHQTYDFEPQREDEPVAAATEPQAFSPEPVFAAERPAAPEVEAQAETASFQAPVFAAEAAAELAETESVTAAAPETQLVKAEEPEDFAPASSGSILDLGYLFSSDDSAHDDQLLDVRSADPESEANTLVFKTSNPAEQQPEETAIVEPEANFNESAAGTETELQDGPEPEANFSEAAPDVTEPEPQNGPEPETVFSEAAPSLSTPSAAPPEPEASFDEPAESDSRTGITSDWEKVFEERVEESETEAPKFERIIDEEEEEPASVVEPQAGGFSEDPEIALAQPLDESYSEVEMIETPQSEDQADGFTEDAAPPAPEEIRLPEPPAFVQQAQAEQPPQQAPQISAEAIEAIAQRVLEKLSERFVRDMAPAMKDMIVDELSNENER